MAELSDKCAWNFPFNFVFLLFQIVEFLLHNNNTDEIKIVMTN